MSTPARSIILGPFVAVIALVVLALSESQAWATDPVTGFGDPGTTSIDLTRHRGVIVEGDAGTRGSLSVACWHGTVVGGGFSHVGKDLQVIESRPDGIYAWQVSWVQASANDSVLYVYASCLTAGL